LTTTRRDPSPCVIHFPNTNYSTDLGCFIEVHSTSFPHVISHVQDPRHKRNKAFTGQQERGAYTHGLGHEVRHASMGNGNEGSDHYGPGGGRAGTGLGTAAASRPPARDPTLDLINKIKADHAAAQGVVVSEYEAERGEKRAREQSERQAAAATRRALNGGGFPAGVAGLRGGAGAVGAAGQQDGAVSIALPPPKVSLGAIGGGAGGGVAAQTLVVGKLVRRERKKLPTMAPTPAALTTTPPSESPTTALTVSKQQGAQVEQRAEQMDDAGAAQEAGERRRESSLGEVGNGGTKENQSNSNQSSALTGLVTYDSSSSDESDHEQAT
jgi:hypothetical protein